MGLDECLGDGEAEAGPAAATILAEHLEDAFALLAGDAGTLVADCDLDPCPSAPRGGPRRHANGAVVGREPFRVLQHVRQDLAHEDVVEVEQGQVARRVDLDAAGRHQAAQRRQRFGDEFVEANRDRPQFQRTGLNAGHVEEVGHEPGQAVRLQLDELEELGPVVRPQMGVDLAQARHGCLDGGERCPQVVRGRAHESAAPAVDLLEEARSQRLLAQLCAIDGERRLVGESAEQAPLPLADLHVLEHEHADGPVAGHQSHRYPAGAGLADQPEGFGLAPARGDGGHVRVRQGLARGGGDAEHLASRRRVPCFVREHERRPARREHALHGVGYVHQQLREGEIADERLRQFEHPLRLGGPLQRLLTCAALLGDDLGHDQYDGDVDDEGDPVLGRAHRQGVVRRQEEEVVKEEAAQRADGTRKESADHHPQQGRQDEGQRRDGDAQVIPKGEQHCQDHAQTGQGDRDTEDRTLVRSLGDQLAWRHVVHSFPSVGGSFECTDAMKGTSQSEVAMSSNSGEDEGVRPTGKFRVYLGAAAGVGKTCAMLDEGWRRFQRGADVVVGFVETHKRPYTMEQIRDLPVVARKQVEYRDAAWEEMDVDAVHRAQARGRADRRAGPHQRAGVGPAREAMGGRPRNPRCGHRRHHDREHPAHRVPGGCRRADHWCRRARAGARLGGAAGRPARADRLLGRPAAATDAARQHLPGGQGAVGAERVLPGRESW